MFIFALANRITEQSDPFSQSISPARSFSQSEVIDIFISGVMSAPSARVTASSLRQLATKALQDSAYTDFISNCTKYLDARGLPINSFSFNGIVQSEADMSSGLMQLLGREQYLLSVEVRKGSITEKTSSIFSAVLEAANAYPRFHSLLEQDAVVYVDANVEGAKGLLTALHFFDQSVSPTVAPFLGIDDVSSGTESDFTNTTMVFVPLTSAGFTSAAAAFKWIAEVAELNTQRLAVGFNLASDLESCTSAGTASIESCPSIDYQSLQAIALVDSLQRLSCRGLRRGVSEDSVGIFEASDDCGIAAAHLLSKVCFVRSNQNVSIS